jgi:hypothetical protein
MKLSVEGKVAAFVAAGFVALTAGMIAQGNSGQQSAGPGWMGSDKQSVIAYDSSVAGRTHEEESNHSAQWQLQD